MIKFLEITLNIIIQRVALNISRKQHPTKKELHRHIPPISSKVRQRFAGHCYRVSFYFDNHNVEWQHLADHGEHFLTNKQGTQSNFEAGSLPTVINNRKRRKEMVTKY